MAKLVVKPGEKSRIKALPKQAPSLSHTEIASKFGAVFVGETKDKHNAIWTLAFIGKQLADRLRSTGGRPSLAGAGPKRKIPVDDDDWRRIQEISGVFKKVAPSQVASIILHSALEKFSEDELEKAVERHKAVTS